MNVIPSERPAYEYALAASFDDLGEASETYPNVIIDPQGDLKLEVQTGNEDSNRTFWVSSSSVRHMSPLWGDAIERVKRRQNMVPYFLRCYENDIKILEEILYLAHLQFHRFTFATTFDELIRLVLFSDRNVTTDFLRPWLEKSAQAWMHKALDPGYEPFILVAYVLEFEGLYDHLSRIFVQDMAKNDTIRWLWPKGTIPSKGDSWGMLRGRILLCHVYSVSC